MTFYFDNGSFRQGTVVNKEIEKEIKRLEKGQISNIIENTDGFSIIRLEDVRDGSIKSFDKVREEIKKDLNMTVAENDIRNYYERNKASLYTEPAGIKVAVILVNDEKKAQDIYNRLEKGEDFGNLARQYSEDYTKDNGGVISEFLKKGDRDEAFDKVAFNLEINEFSKPVLTEYGFQIIKLLEKRSEKVFSLKEKRDEIVEELLTPKRNEIYVKWMKEQKNNRNTEELQEFQFVNKIF